MCALRMHAANGAADSLLHACKQCIFIKTKVAERESALR
jgi:hypothetical protein